MRTLFIIMGLAAFLPSVIFMSMFHPPVYFIDYKKGLWWLAAALRLLSLAVAAGGLRLMVLNISSANKPLHFNSWVDETTAVATIILAGLASLVFFGVYLSVRIWPKETDGDEQL